MREVVASIAAAKPVLRYNPFQLSTSFPEAEAEKLLWIIWPWLVRAATTTNTPRPKHAIL